MKQISERFKEHLRKIGFQAGNVPYNKGEKVIFSKKHRENLSIAVKKRKITWGDKISKAKTGRPNYKLRGYKHSQKSIENMRDGHKKLYEGGYTNPMKHQKRPDLIERNKNNPLIGKDNPSWVDGRSYIPYSYEFKRIRKKILRRDNNTCKLCFSKIDKQEKYKFITVHHIDYNKNNNSEENLITLCNPCNLLANKDREKWKRHFRGVVT